MENDDVFVSEAQVDNQVRGENRAGASRARSRPSSAAKRIGEAILGGQNETSPLLGNASGDGRRASDVSEWIGSAELEGLPWWNRPSIFWLLPPFLLFAMAFGGIIVPKLNLILELICRDYYAEQSASGFSRKPDVFNNEDQCRSESVSARVSLFTLYANLCSGILAAITSPKLGALSDRFGRKKILVFTTFGILVGEVITIIAAKFPETIDVNWILVGYAADGLCGSFIVGMAIAHSYATDCTPPQKRNVAFGYFHACLFTGIAAGPLIAGEIIKKTGNILVVFYIALGCHLIFIAFLLFCIPESLSKSRQEIAREKHRQEMDRLGPTSDWVNQLRSVNLIAPLKILWPTGPGTSRQLRWNLVLLALVDMIMFGVAMSAMGVVVIYTRLQFGWKSYESSIFASVVNSCRVFCLLVALPLITHFVRGKNGASRGRNSGSDLFDLSVIRIAVFFDMLGYLGYTLSRNGELFMLSGAVTSLGGIGSPALGAALTKHVPADKTGQLLGTIGLLHAFARVIGPTIFNGIYYQTVHTYRQTVFVCLTVTFGLAFVVSWFARPHVYLEDIQGEQDGRERQPRSREGPGHSPYHDP